MANSNISTSIVQIVPETTIISTGNTVNIPTAVAIEATTVTTTSSLVSRPSGPSQAEIENQRMLKEYSNEESYTHINTISTINTDDLAEIRDQYRIPATYSLRAPLPTERMFHRPNGWTAISLSALKYGVRFPLHSFIITLLGFIGVGFAQLVPNSYIHLISFIAFCYECDVTPTIDFFFTLFSLSRSRESGFRQINKQQSKQIEKRPLMKTPSSNKGWHSQWLFVRGPDIHQLPDWAEASRSNIQFDKFTQDRLVELKSLIAKLPHKEWDIELLNDQTWLYNHRRKSRTLISFCNILYSTTQTLPFTFYSVPYQTDTNHRYRTINIDRSTPNNNSSFDHASYNCSRPFNYNAEETIHPDPVLHRKKPIGYVRRGEEQTPEEEEEKGGKTFG